jgi:signal transduction histidine kinase
MFTTGAVSEPDATPCLDIIEQCAWSQVSSLSLPLALSLSLSRWYGSGSSLFQARMVDDLLDSTRLLTGRLSLDMQDVVLTELVQAATESIRKQAGEKELRLNVSLPAATVIMRGDPVRLKQIFWYVIRRAARRRQRRLTIFSQEHSSQLCQVHSKGR